MNSEKNTDEDDFSFIDKDNVMDENLGHGRPKYVRLNNIPNKIRIHYSQAMNILLLIAGLYFQGPEINETIIKDIRETIKPLCEKLKLSNSIIAIDSLELIEGPDKHISEDKQTKFYNILLKGILSDFGVYKFIKSVNSQVQ